MEEIVLKCTVVGGHYVPDFDRKLEYNEKVTVQKSQLDASETLQGALSKGQLVIESRKSYQENTRQQQRTPTVEVGSSSTSLSEPTSIQVEAPEIDLSSMESLLKDQNSLLQDILSELRAQEGVSRPIDVSSLLENADSYEDEGSALGDGPEYVPSDIRSGEMEVSNPVEAEESESSSGGVDEAAQALESMQKDNDE